MRRMNELVSWSHGRGLELLCKRDHTHITGKIQTLTRISSCLLRILLSTTQKVRIFEGIGVLGGTKSHLYRLKSINIHYILNHLSFVFQWKNKDKNKNEILSSIIISQIIFAYLFKEKHVLLWQKGYNTCILAISKCF